MFQKAKQIFLQYYNGSKLLVAESKQVHELLISRKQLTRPEHQLVYRNANDRRKMVPFFFLVLVLPEVIPFLLMRGASIVPSTCITEEERDKVYRKLDSKRSQMAKELDECFDDSICTKQELLKPQKTLQISTLHRQYFELGLLSRSTLVDLSRVFGFSQYRTTRGLRKVLERHHEYLRVQDAHLSTELDSLSDQELIHACQERSIRTTDVPIDKLREELRDWIQTSLMEDPSVPFGLLIIRQLLKQSSSSL